VSIFVNPIQFDRRDDFDRYPRTLADDVAQCERAGVDAVFTPAPAAMYPRASRRGRGRRAHGAALWADRQGHFRGVTTVVAKLFHAVRPHVAVFGEKDYQQLAVVRRMTADLDFGIEIVGVPTVREGDGVALSSRNARLARADREAARCIPRALGVAGAVVATGERRAAAVVGRAEAEIAREPRATAGIRRAPRSADAGRGVGGDRAGAAGDGGVGGGRTVDRQSSARTGRDRPMMPQDAPRQDPPRHRDAGRHRLRGDRSPSTATSSTPRISSRTRPSASGT
jgi:hypothetical protein